MKVKELIEKLQEVDQEAMVVVSGYEGGVNEVDNVSPVHLRLNVNTAWWYGKHEVNREDSDDLPNGVYIF